METNEKVLKPEESLQIIETMIKRTKGNLHDSSFYFLLWGWIVLIIIIGQLAMKYLTNFSKPYLMWFVIIPGIIASAIYGYKQGKKNKTSTHLDRINFMVWIAFLISYALVIVFAKEFNYRIGTIIFLLAGNATFITGIIIKFRPLILGGIIFWLGAILMFLLPNNYMEFISPVIIIFGYLLPGYLLRMQNKKDA